MLGTRWSPFWTTEMGRLQREMNRVLDNFGLGEITGPVLGYAYPPINVWEDNDNVYAEAELPGMSEEELTVLVSEGNMLTLEGERKPPEIPGTLHRQERGLGKFKRTITLPNVIDADKVAAKFEHGVLSLVLPKSPAVKPRKIMVKGESPPSA